MSDQSLADEDQLATFGMMIVTEDAFAVGITAIPGPGTDSSNDWFVWQPMYNRRQVVTSIGITDPSGTQYTIDSKAQRVFEIGTRIVLVGENLNPGGTGGLSLNFNLRILTKIRA